MTWLSTVSLLYKHYSMQCFCVFLLGCLDAQISDNRKDNRPSKPPRRTSTVNKPESLYSQDVYDKAFHRS